MSYRKLPRTLRNEIVDYYEHRYNGKFFNEVEILQEVSECIRDVSWHFRLNSQSSSLLNDSKSYPMLWVASCVEIFYTILFHQRLLNTELSTKHFLQSF